MPRGTMKSPAKKNAGNARYDKMPMYGFWISPRSVVGSRKSQDTVAEVTIAIPTMLSQLSARYTRDDNQAPNNFPGIELFTGRLLFGSGLLPFLILMHLILMHMILMHSNAITGVPGAIHRINFGIENCRIKVPDYDRQRRQDCLIEVHRGSHIQPVLRKEGKHQVIGPQDAPGGYHDDGAPDNRPILGLFNVAMRRPRRFRFAQPHVVRKRARRLGGIAQARRQLKPVAAQLAAHDQRDQVGDADRDKHNGG